MHATSTVRILVMCVCTSMCDSTHLSTYVGPPAAPTVVLYDRTLTSVTVEWYEPFSDPSAPVLYYEVSIDGGQNRILSSDQRMATFSGLTHNRVYSIAVRANNTVGFGDRGFLNATTVTPLGEPVCVVL